MVVEKKTTSSEEKTVDGLTKKYMDEGGLTFAQAYAKAKTELSAS